MVLAYAWESMPLKSEIGPMELILRLAVCSIPALFGMYLLILYGFTAVAILVALFWEILEQLSKFAATEQSVPVSAHASPQAEPQDPPTTDGCL